LTPDGKKQVSVKEKSSFGGLSNFAYTQTLPEYIM